MANIKIHWLYILIFFSATVLAQPSPLERYPHRIAEITEQLKTDSLNYNLVFERLKMQVALLPGSNLLADPFAYNEQSIIPYDAEAKNSMDSDFRKVYANVIARKNFDEIEEGDFYLTRAAFYTKTFNFDMAYADAAYVKDNVSYSRIWLRGENYKERSLDILFSMSVLKKDFNKALEVINLILNREKEKNNVLYFTHSNSSYRKVRLYEHFGKCKELISYIKQLSKDNFNWYFERVKEGKDNHSVMANDQYADKQDYIALSQNAKEMGFGYLLQLVEYMQKYNDNQIAKYRSIIDRLRTRVNSNTTTINKDINDYQLWEIIKEI